MDEPGGEIPRTGRNQIRRRGSIPDPTHRQHVTVARTLAARGEGDIRQARLQFRARYSQIANRVISQIRRRRQGNRFRKGNQNRRGIRA